MGYSYKFADNTIYGAEDVNDVINEFVTAGVADVFFDGTSYNTSDLNKIAASFATGGIKYTSSTSCKAVKYSSGSIKIMEGTAFFSDGSILKIDSAGVILNYVKGKKNYVYLKGNINAENKNEVCCTLNQGTGDIVQIAVIDESENIIDKREFCRGKIAGYQSSFSKPKKIMLNYSLSGGNNAYQDFAFDLEGYGHSHIIDISLKERRIKNDFSGPYTMGVYDILNNYSVALCLRNNKFETHMLNENKLLVSPSNSSSLATAADIYAGFTIKDTILNIRITIEHTLSESYLHTGSVILLVV